MILCITWGDLCIVLWHAQLGSESWGQIINNCFFLRFWMSEYVTIPTKMYIKSYLYQLIPESLESCALHYNRHSKFSVWWYVFCYVQRIKKYQTIGAFNTWSVLVGVFCLCANCYSPFSWWSPYPSRFGFPLNNFCSSLYRWRHRFVYVWASTFHVGNESSPNPRSRIEETRGLSSSRCQGASNGKSKLRNVRTRTAQYRPWQPSLRCLLGLEWGGEWGKILLGAAIAGWKPSIYCQVV